jgi:hypothetical protein
LAGDRFRIIFGNSKHSLNGWRIFVASNKEKAIIYNSWKKDDRIRCDQMQMHLTYFLFELIRSHIASDTVW